jgi:DNA-binding NarL/FixJ family response regulator
MKVANARLTDRQAQVIRLAGAGLKDEAIACELCISLSGVRRHWRTLFEKFNVHTARAVIWEYARAEQNWYVGKDRKSGNPKP